MADQTLVAPKAPTKRPAVHEWLRAKKRFPHLWCPGCGIGIVLGSTIRALEHYGFSVVEIISNCHTYYGRINKEGGPVEMVKAMREKSVMVTESMDYEKAKAAGKPYVIGVVHRDTVRKDFVQSNIKALYMGYKAAKDFMVALPERKRHRIRDYSTLRQEGTMKKKHQKNGKKDTAGVGF